MGGVDHRLLSRSNSMDRLESENQQMTPFKACPVCGGELHTKKVEKILRGDRDTVSLQVEAEVCRHCGERLYSEEVVKSFEEIRSKLKKKEFTEFRPLGQAFTVSQEWPNKAIQPAAYSSV